MGQNALGSLFDLVVGVLPLDLQTARTGDYVSLKNWGHLTVAIVKGLGTDGDDQTFTFNQATSVAGGSAKGLNVSEYFEKEAGTDLTGTGVWTRVTQTAASTVAPGDPSAQDAALYVFEFDADQLDVDNGFDCVSVDNDGAGSNAQLGAILYILSRPRYATAPANLPNPIID